MAQKLKSLAKIIFSLLIILSLSSNYSFASSSLVLQKSTSTYVLPYPSSMPGSFLYKPRLLWEELLKYWYFGNFGQFKYNLKESDKYLVESKTLFEYNQFLNASLSLKKSDRYFLNTLPYLIRAKNEGKDTSQNREILREAALKHIEVLKKLSTEVPDEFNWKPEKESSSVIHIREEIDNSVAIREKYL